MAVFAVTSAVLSWACREEILAAIQVWSRSATFGHGFFIFPISLVLFYRLRHRLAALVPTAAPWAFVPALFAVFAWMLGDLANLMMVKQFAFVCLWQCLFLLVFGRSVARAAIFPLVYLYLAVPFGSSIIPALQDVTAQIVVHLLRLTGLPVFLDGYYIQIPSGAFLVAEACSGVRYLMVSLAIGILAAYLFFDSWRRRLAFVALSALVPVIANGVRAYGIIMLAHLSDYRIAVDVDHVVYGFVFLGIVMLALLGLGAMMRDRHGPPEPEAGTATTREAPQVHRATAGPLPIQSVGAALAMAALLLGQAWTAAAKAPPADPAPAIALPSPAAPWQASSTTPSAGWQPRFRGNDLSLSGRYRLEDTEVDLHIAYYAYQRDGAEAISDLNILGGKEWQTLHQVRGELATSQASLPYVQLLLTAGAESYVVWYWYRIGEYSTNDRLRGKLLELVALFGGGEKSAAMIAIGSRVVEDVEQTEALMRSFVEAHIDDGGSLVRRENIDVGGKPRDDGDGNTTSAEPQLGE